MKFGLFNEHKVLLIEQETADEGCSVSPVLQTELQTPDLWFTAVVCLTYFSWNSPGITVAYCNRNLPIPWKGVKGRTFSWACVSQDIPNP